MTEQRPSGMTPSQLLRRAKALQAKRDRYHLEEKIAHDRRLMVERELYEVDRELTRDV